MAMQRAMGFARLWSIDGGRAMIEALPPQTYLAASYYAKWLMGLERTSSAPAWSAPTRSPPAARCVPPQFATRVMAPADVRKSQTRRVCAPRPGAGALQARRPRPHRATSTRRPTRGCRAMRATRSARSRRCAAATSIPTPPRSARAKIRNGFTPSCSAARDLWGADADPTLTVSIEAFEPYLVPA